MATVQMICHCGEEYSAREADLKRGWGYSCSKSCAALRRDFGKPKAKRVDGIKTKQTQRSPDGYRPNDPRQGERDIEYANIANEEGWDGHKNAW